MAPDFADRSPDDDQFREKEEGDLGYAAYNPSSARDFEDFVLATSFVDHIRVPAVRESEALLSDGVADAVTQLLGEFDEGLYQGRASGHASLTAIDTCFSYTKAADVREVFLVVRDSIDRTLQARFDEHGESQTDTAAAHLLYDQLLRSACESIVVTTFDNILRGYEERLQNVFIKEYCEGTFVQYHRLALLGCDTDFDEAGRDAHARAIYEEKVAQAERISQKVLSQEYRQMMAEYPVFIELAISELYDLAPDLMAPDSDDEDTDPDEPHPLELEWRKRYAPTFKERLTTSHSTAREQLQSALKQLLDALPPSAKGLQ